eukprot:4542-Heterococcus_DN1.PRE.3
MRLRNIGCGASRALHVGDTTKMEQYSDQLKIKRQYAVLSSFSMHVPVYRHNYVLVHIATATSSTTAAVTHTSVLVQASLLQLLNTAYLLQLSLKVVLCTLNSSLTCSTVALFCSGASSTRLYKPDAAAVSCVHKSIEMANGCVIYEV